MLKSKEVSTCLYRCVYRTSADTGTTTDVGPGPLLVSTGPRGVNPIPSPPSQVSY